METLRHKLDDHLDDTAVSSPSPEMFSFPGTPTEADDGESSSEFEFGSCVTPDSPMMNSNLISSDNNNPGSIMRSTASPADQFFLNGRLLPHDFPVIASRTSFSGRENAGRPERETNSNNNKNANDNISSNSNVYNLSRGTSVGSSMSCKDSLMSSRSNSNNSRGSVVSGGGGSTCSTCSSARTSSSEVSERRAFQKRMRGTGTGSVNRNGSTPLGQYQQFGGSSRRWQFITPAPVLGPSQSMRGRKETGVGPTASPCSSSKKKKRGERSNSNNEGLLQRILRSFVATCKACHAMEGEKEFDLDDDNGSVVMGN